MAVAAAIGAGATPSDTPRPADRYRALDTFAQALAYVSNDYVDPSTRSACSTTPPAA